MLIKSKNLKEAMIEGLWNLRAFGRKASPRGMETRELLNVQIEIENPKESLAYLPGRGFNLAFSVAEFLSYVGGINSVDYISQFNDNIAQFSDNGINFYGSYGARIAHQIPKIIEQLRSNPDTRQANLTIFTTQDMLKDTKDTPCTVSIDFKLRDNKLYTHVFMRSNDLIWGFQYDMFNFTLLQQMIANSLGVEVGTYTHTATSLHIYERHFEMFDELNNYNSFGKSIEVDFKQTYDQVLETAKESIAYSKGYCQANKVIENELLAVLNFYNLTKQVTFVGKQEFLYTLNNNDWATKFYELVTK